MECPLSGRLFNRAAVIRWPLAEVLLKGIGEVKGVVVSHQAGNGADLLVGLEKEGGSTSHAKVGEVFDGASLELLLIESSKLFDAEVSDAGESFERPIVGQHSGSGFPNDLESGVEGVVRVEPRDVVVDEFDPMVQVTF